MKWRMHTLSDNSDINLELKFTQQMFWRCSVEVKLRLFKRQHFGYVLQSNIMLRYLLFLFRHFAAVILRTHCKL